jgi:uncharacterized Ntn-hydrolase superfamily protein
VTVAIAVAVAFGATAAVFTVRTGVQPSSPPPPPTPSAPAAGLASPASYSILGHDPLTGEFGVAAASNAPLIGVNLEFFDPEAGGVVVHGGPFLEINRRALTALREGVTPGVAIQVGLVGVEDREERQVLALGPTGAAAFTGEDLEGAAAQSIGELSVAAGYRLASDEVPEKMREAFESTDASLADRLLLALQAGRDAGGEKDGARSAALLVVGPGARHATRGRLVDVRIDFDPGDAVAALDSLKARVDSVYGIER